MSETLMEALQSTGWTYHESIPILNGEEESVGESVGEIYFFTKNDESLQIFHYFYLVYNE